MSLPPSTTGDAPFTVPDLNATLDPLLGELEELRRDLHAHPQVAYQETYAAGVIQDRLKALGIDFQGELAQTGVVGWIMPEDKGAAKRPAVGLRADIDALAIPEATGLAYASQNAGVMHACGHDGHTAALLGAAAVLVAKRDCLPQPVKLIFQPAEELLGGAAKIIEAGGLGAEVGGVAVGRLFGWHNWPSLPLGTLAERDGAIMAGFDGFRIEVTGTGGHGAMPHLTTDPLVAGAQVVTALQTVVSRAIDPTESAVLSIGRLRSGDAENVIPATAHIAGTVRYLTPGTRRQLHRRILAIAEQTAQAFGCRAEVVISSGYPPTVNDPPTNRHYTRVARPAMAEVIQLDQPCMTAEDFAFYGEQVPCAFALLGSHDESDPQPKALHTADYDFNDDALPFAIGLLCAPALARLPDQPAAEGEAR